MKTTDQLIRSFLKSKNISVSNKDRIIYRLSGNRLQIDILHNDSSMNDLNFSLLEYLTFLFNNK